MSADMEKTVLVLGGGVAGMECALSVRKGGHQVILLEKDNQLGGHVSNWHHLFPNQRPAHEVIENLVGRIREQGVECRFNSQTIGFEHVNGRFHASLKDGGSIEADALVLATGFRLFDARIKEEYGYGIYNHVISSAELEEIFRTGKPIINASGKAPKRIGIVHCVGSRDEKVGHTYCSQVCCVTAVKQAIELRRLYPQCEVFCFYMDLRMFGLQFEDLYKEAQEIWGVNFIRGRLSEACENIDGSIVVKVEDTLAGRPLKMNVDLLVLMVGFVPAASQLELSVQLNSPVNHDGFFVPEDEHLRANVSKAEGVFLAGTGKGPKTIADTMADARSAAIEVLDYLNKLA
jgi:heterodisulfide reductase subunit A2